MGLVRKSLAGMEVEFIKDKINNCINCEYKCKKFFRNEYVCNYTLGLFLDDGLYGKCSHYKKDSNDIKGKKMNKIIHDEVKIING